MARDRIVKPYYLCECLNRRARKAFNRLYRDPRMSYDEFPSCYAHLKFLQLQSKRREMAWEIFNTEEVSYGMGSPQQG